MLPQNNRLKKNENIRKVLDKGKRFKEDFLILKIRANNLKQTRFAFIVSQRFSKKATLRNKIRRKLRELVSSKLKTLKKGLDAIIIAVPGLETKDFWEIDETMNKLFKKAKIIKKDND